MLDLNSFVQLESALGVDAPSQSPKTDAQTNERIFSVFFRNQPTDDKNRPKSFPNKDKEDEGERLWLVVFASASASVLVDNDIEHDCDSLLVGTPVPLHCLVVFVRGPREGLCRH